jgi:hypothetical protein
MNGSALGLIETQGLVGLINAVDAMLKAASVELASSTLAALSIASTAVISPTSPCVSIRPSALPFMMTFLGILEAGSVRFVAR